MKDYERCIILPFDKNSLNFTEDEELNYAYLEQTIKYINELLKSDDCKGLYLNDLCEIFAIPIKHTYIEYITCGPRIFLIIWWVEILTK